MRKTTYLLIGTLNRYNIIDLYNSSTELNQRKTSNINNYISHEKVQYLMTVGCLSLLKDKNEIHIDTSALAQYHYVMFVCHH